MGSRFAIGFNTLYDFVVNRPGLRAEALNILLELTTHPGGYKSDSNSKSLITGLRRKAYPPRGNQSCQAMGTPQRAHEHDYSKLCLADSAAFTKATYEIGFC